MKGTVAYITKSIQPRLKEMGFKKAKYCFEKNLHQNYKVTLLITSKNYIDFQDLEVVIYLLNEGMFKIMQYLEEFYHNQPHSRIIRFNFDQYNKMSDNFWGSFNHDKYEVATEEEANIFISDMNSFLERTLFSDKINAVTQIDTIEKLINEPDIFTSSVVNNVAFSRFYEGLVFSKLSSNDNLEKVFSKYLIYTNGWKNEAKEKIENLFFKLKNTSKSTIEKIYYE